MQTVPEELGIHAGREAIFMDCNIVRLSCFSIRINKPDPWFSIPKVINQLVSLLPPLVACTSWMSAVRCMGNKNPARQEFRLALDN